MKSKKGIIITISTIVLMALLVAFITSAVAVKRHLANALSEEQVIDYSDYYFNDISWDVQNMSKTKVETNRNSSTLNITISGSMPMNSSFSSSLTNYSTYIIGTFSQKTHSNITLDVSGANDSTFEIFFSYPNNTMMCMINYTGSNSLLFASVDANENTNAIRYEVNITTNKTRRAETQFAWDPGGDINIILYYQDANGSEVQNGTILSTLAHNAIWNYTDGSSISVYAGKIGNRTGAFSLNPSNTSLTYRLSAFFPLAPNASVRTYYNITMGYWQGGNSKISQLVLSTK